MTGPSNSYQLLVFAVKNGACPAAPWWTAKLKKLFPPVRLSTKT